MKTVKALIVPGTIFLSFWIFAVLFWQITGSLFFIFNFGYIGTAIGIGLSLYSLLPGKKKQIGRRIAQLLVGLYLLGYLGLMMKENMQIEGFFLLLLSGYFAASVIHYIVAKILGPLIYGRGYCSWACWTSMFLDFLPFKENRNGRTATGWGLFRYIHFALSLLLVLSLWFLFDYRPEPRGDSALVWLIVGNTLYFSTSIILAFVLKDNRAFCKYICPVTVILKLTTRFSLLKIEGDKEKCTGCGLCNKSCPMDIDIVKYVRRGERVLSTECISCFTCTAACPKGALKDTFGLDIGGKEYLQRKIENEGVVR